MMILLLFCTQQMIAQKTTVTAPDMPRDETTNLIKYQEVVDMPGTLIPELAKRATNWGKKYFVNWNGLGAVVDTINGKITVKPQFNVYRTLKDGTKAIANVIRYEMTIDLKDGKYRVTITNFTIKAASIVTLETLFDESSSTKEDNFNQLHQVDDTMNALLESLKDAMNIPSNEVKKDDW